MSVCVCVGGGGRSSSFNMNNALNRYCTLTSANKRANTFFGKGALLGFCPWSSFDVDLSDLGPFKSVRAHRLLPLPTLLSSRPSRVWYVFGLVLASRVVSFSTLQELPRRKPLVIVALLARLCICLVISLRSSPECPWQQLFIQESLKVDVEHRHKPA